MKQTRPGRSQRSLSLHESGTSGFTLIELLVVIAVIALLLGILLPALGKARDTGRQVVCLSGVRQIGMAALLYAQDHKELLWPPNQWARMPDAYGSEPGYLFQYVEKLDKIGECPSNKRRSVNGNGDGNNMFNTGTDLDFDFTMVAKIGGIKLSCATRVSYLPPNSNRAARFTLNTPEADALIPFQGMPIFVEENTYWYNAGIPDGLWGNEDQITQRHFKGGHVSTLDGSSFLWKAPAGPQESLFDGDFITNDLYVMGQTESRFWIQLDGTRARPWGWINNPTAR